MTWLDMPNWDSMFSPDLPLLESFLRCSVMYLLIFTVMRILPRRHAGEMGMTDMVLIILVAEASSQAMIGESFSLSNGIVLVCTLFFWNYTLHWLALRSSWIEKFVHPQPIELIKDGKILRKNLRREMITEDLLKSEIREEGIEDPEEVKVARIEGDGKTSIIPKEE